MHSNLLLDKQRRKSDSPDAAMTTDEADAIIEVAARYFRNTWDPDGNSQSSRELILQAARVLLGGEGEAEAAARKLWATVKLADEALGWIAPWSLPPSELERRNAALASIHDALAHYSEFAPDRNESG